MNRANRRSLSLNLSSTRFRSLMSDATPIMRAAPPDSSVMTRPRPDIQWVEPSGRTMRNSMS